MLLDPETFDLVQHVETVLAAIARPRARDADQPRADAVGARDRDAGLPHGRRRDARAARRCAATSAASRAQKGLRVGSAGTHPFSLFERQRITAKDRYRAAGRPAPVHRPPRADLRHARPRRGRRPRQGDQGGQRPPAPARAAARALRQLAVLARRADRARVEPADGLLRVPPLRAAAALPRLRRLRRGRRPARAHGLHRRLHAHLVGHPPASAAAGRSRSGSATRVTRVEDAVAITAYCQALVKQLCERFEAGEEIPTYHRILTSENKWLAARYGLEAPVMDLATGRRRSASPLAKLVRTHAARARAACPRARLGARARGHRRDPRPRQLRRPPAARSSTRIATSSRSCARSRTRPSRCLRRSRPGLPQARAQPATRSGLWCAWTTNSLLSIVASCVPARPRRTSERPITLHADVEELALVALPGKLDAERLPPHRVERVDEGEAAGLLVERVRPDATRREGARDRQASHRAAAAPRVDNRLAQECSAHEIVGAHSVRRTARRRILDEVQLPAVRRERVERP